MANQKITVDGRAPDQGNSAIPYTLFKETPSTKVPWYRDSIGPRLSPEMQYVFEIYSNLPKAEIIPHIDEIRSKAWKTRAYPCIGSYGFLATPMLKSPLLETLVARLQNGDNFIDLGTCFGQELRMLANAGAPTENMFALDLIPDFWEISFELFRDREKMKGHFIKADFMSIEDMDGVSDLKALQGKTDIIHAGYFFHLFGWEGQIEALMHVVKLSCVGTVLVGHQIGRATAEEVTTTIGGVQKQLFYHNDESWRRIWEKVQRKTNTKWDVQCECIGLGEGEFGLPLEDYNWMATNARALKFVVRRLEDV